MEVPKILLPEMILRLGLHKKNRIQFVISIFWTKHRQPGFIHWPVVVCIQ